MALSSRESTALAFGVLALCQVTTGAALFPFGDVHVESVLIMVLTLSVAGSLVATARSTPFALAAALLIGWVSALLEEHGAARSGTRAAFDIVLWPGALVLVTLAGRAIDDTRRGSIAQRVHRHALGTVTAIPVLLACCFPLHGYPEYPELLRVASVVTLFGVALIALDHLASWRELGRAPSGLLDYGIGREREDLVEPVPSSYRTSAVRVTTVVGSRSGALGVVRRALILDLVVLAGGLGGLAYSWDPPPRTMFRADYAFEPCHAAKPTSDTSK